MSQDCCKQTGWGSYRYMPGATCFICWSGKNNLKDFLADVIIYISYYIVKDTGKKLCVVIYIRSIIHNYARSEIASITRKLCA